MPSFIQGASRSARDLYQKPNLWYGEFHDALDRLKSKYAVDVGQETGYFELCELTRPSHVEDFHKSFDSVVSYDRRGQQFGLHSAVLRRGAIAKSAENLQQRLANANDYFRRKASEVFNDEDALRLLSSLYQDVVVDISDFDSCKDGLSLARLTAANFCEVGVNVIYITEAGQRFIDSLKTHGQI